MCSKNRRTEALKLQFRKSRNGKQGLGGVSEWGEIYCRVQESSSARYLSYLSALTFALISTNKNLQDDDEMIRESMFLRLVKMCNERMISELSPSTFRPRAHSAHNSHNRIFLLKTFRIGKKREKFYFHKTILMNELKSKVQLNPDNSH